MASTAGFDVGDEVLIMQMQGVGAGGYEFGIVAGIGPSSLALRDSLQNGYAGHSFDNRTCGGVFRAGYFGNRNLSGTPSVVRCEPSIWFDWGNWSPGLGLPGDNFSVRWRSQTMFPTSSNYTFQVTVDDGVRIYVDDNLILNEWHDAASATYTVNPFITAGAHTVTVEYYESGGGAVIRLSLPGNLHYSSAQVVRVPHFQNVIIQAGGKLTASPWNGLSGGLIVFRAAGEVTVDGAIEGAGLGYRGFEKWTSQSESGHQGESTDSMIVRSRNSNRTGGGGGEGYGDGGAGGAGGSHASSGTVGASRPGGGPANGISATAIVGNETLSPLVFFGGGGGSGGSDDSAGAWDPYPCGMGGKGGAGGGIVAIYGRSVNVSGLIKIGGQNGGPGGWLCSGGAGGGGGAGGRAGGSLLLKAGSVSLSTNGVTALGGNGGAGVSAAGSGGNGGVGRIRIEHCGTLSGSTSPTASIQGLDCYVTEQAESTPSTMGSLKLPEAVQAGESRTYQVQYAREVDFTVPGDQTILLRMPATRLSSATLDALVSPTASGEITLRLDVGGDGSWDWEITQDAEQAITFSSPELATTFNDYWIAQGALISGNLDIPIVVSLNVGGQVLLTNLHLDTASSKLHTVRLSAGIYTDFDLDFSLEGIGDEPLRVSMDVGDDGSIDWSSNTIASVPYQQITDDLAAVINTYLGDKSGQVDVPIRVFVPPHHLAILNDYQATAVPAVDLAATAITVGISTPDATIIAGDMLPMQATVQNSGSANSGPVTLAFFATAQGLEDQYIGSTFVSNIRAGDSASGIVEWNTIGLTGEVSIKAIVDPFERVYETDRTNNVTETVLSIIPPLQQPKADFLANYTLCQVACAVQFTDLSSPDADITAWLWDFGDGITSTQQNPQHFYGGPGSYDVTLTVSAPGGRDTHFRQSYIIVNAATTLSLEAGWNLVALSVRPTDSAITRSLISILDRTEMVYAYQGCDANDPWKKYVPDAPSFVNDLIHVNETMGIWVKLLSSGQLEMQGSSVSSQEIPLCPGWNLVGFPARQSQPVDQALSSLAGCVNRVYGYNPEDTSGPWQQYDPSAPEFANDLKQLEPGHGYWLLAGEYCTWRITSTP